MNHTFDLAALRTIVTAARLGSFSRAADYLGRSQSAVSMQLKKLETQSGTALFVRDGKKLVPTEAGQLLLAYAEKILKLNDEAAALLETQATRSSVRLGLPQDFAKTLLPDILSQFNALYPNVEVEAHIGRNYALCEEVQRAELDVALVFTPDIQPSNTVIAALEMAWVGTLIAPPTDQNSPVPLVAFNFPCEFRKCALSVLEKEKRLWRYTLTTPSLDGIWAALQAGLGVTLRTKYQTPDYLSQCHDLPEVPVMYVKQVAHNSLTPAAQTLSDVVAHVAQTHLSEWSVL